MLLHYACSNRQQAVELQVVEPHFFEEYHLHCIWKTNGNEKWVELVKWLCNRDAQTKTDP